MATQATDSSKSRLRSSSSDELAVIAQRAQAFTNASGAAIALCEGSADEIVCRARSGSSAPDVGVSLRVEGSFTGLCIQSGKELRCDDAETDTRVDTAAIRALGIRSMVVTPVRDDNKVVGVLAVFAPTPHAFTITHVAVLKTMADQISALLLKERRAKDEAFHNEPVVTAPKPAPVAPPPPPVVIKPNGSGTAVAMAPVRVPAPAPKPEPIRAAVVEAPAPVPFPKREDKREDKREERRVEAHIEPVAKPSFDTFDAVAEERKPSGGNKFMLVGIAVVVAVIAVASWLLLKKGKASPSQSAPVATASNSTSAPQPGAAAVVPNGSSPSNGSAPLQPSGTTSSNPKPGSGTEVKAETKKPEQPKNASEQSKPVPTPATVALSTSGSSRISATNAQPQSVQDVPPSLPASGGGTSALSSLIKPVGSSAPAMMATSEFTPVQLLHSVPAVYPAIAKARRLKGSVTVKVTIGKDGKVNNPRFVSGAPVFRDAAFDAVKQWQYKPAMLNGQPVEQEQEIQINFK